MDLIEPATGDVLATVAAQSVDDVDRAVTAAHRAFTAGPWRTLNTRERGTHVALLAVLAIVTALNLALIVALEHPFSGSIAVSDQPLRVGVLAPSTR